MSLLHKEDTKTKLTPKDFVLYALMMFTLVANISAFLVLLFQYINYLYPDPLQYVDPYSGAMRFSIATLLVMFPIFLALTRITNQDIRKHPEKKELPFRKWLIYIALLVGGLTLVFDLIALINSFLGGDLTMQFALKVLAIFVVVGGAFTYYLLLLRGYWDTREQLSIYYGGAVTLFVLVTIIAGFFIMGSPADQRERRIDQERIGHLGEIQWQVVQYWQQTGELPESLAQLENDLIFRAPRDPETGEAYRYEVRDELVFALCADFSRASDPRMSRSVSRPYPGFADETWEHEAGEHCFERTIDPARYPERRMPLPVN